MDTISVKMRKLLPLFGTLCTCIIAASITVATTENGNTQTNNLNKALLSDLSEAAIQNKQLEQNASADQATNAVPDISITGQTNQPSGMTENTEASPLSTPSPEINSTYFHDQLAPFGKWMEIPGHGQCWYPEKIVARNPEWRPYYDSGRWVHTDNGLFWESNYKWGDIPFHYGRWFKDNDRWMWKPDYTWGPAWVHWRHAEKDGAIGWAPLPPGAEFANGVWKFNGHEVVDHGFNFGLHEDHFAFVRQEHLHEEFPHRLIGHEREYAVFHIERQLAHELFVKSVIRNEFRKDEFNRLIHEGIGREYLARIEQLIHHKMEHVHFEVRHPVGDRERLAAERIEHMRHLGEHAHEQQPTEVHHPNGDRERLAAEQAERTRHLGEHAHEQQPVLVSKVFRPPTTPEHKPSPVAPEHISSPVTGGSQNKYQNK